MSFADTVEERGLLRVVGNGVSLEEVGRSLGRGPFTVLRTITLPLAPARHRGRRRAGVPHLHQGTARHGAAS